MSGGREPDMDWRSLPLARTVACGFVVMAVAALAGCGSDSRLYEEAKTAAESSLATGLRMTTTQTTGLLEDRTAMSQITTEDIIGIFLTDARSYETEPLDAIQTRALFGLTESSDGSVTFSVFINASVYRTSGLTTSSQARHSCGEITGRFGEGVVSVSDLDCPPVFAQRAGEDSVYLSMTANAEKYGVSVGTSP